MFSFKRLLLYLKSLILLLAISFKPLSAQFTIVGDATQMSDNCVLLTPAQNSKKGGMWYNIQTNLNCPFDYTYRVNLGNRDNDGADGIAFVLLKKNNVDGNTFGMPGEGIGYGVGVWAGNNYTVMQPSLAIEIDTWHNGNFDLVRGAQCDHISIHKNGNYTTPLIPPVSALDGNCNIEDGQYHDFRVKWDPAAKTIEAYIDGVLRITYTEDIINTIFGGAANVWWGYTASTGGAMNDQIVCPVWLQNEEVCLGQPFTLNYTGAQADQYIWNWDGATATPGVGKGPHTISWNSTGAKTVTLKTVKGQCTIEVALQKVFVVKPAPAAGFTATPQSRCVGQIIQAVFTAQEMAGATYRWNFDAGAVPATATTKGPINVRWSTGGTKTIRLQVSLNGCVSEATQTVVIHSPPAPPIITGPSSICAGDSLILTASSLDATSYLWRGPNLSPDSTGASVTATGLGAGVYTFTAQAISAAGCTSALASQTVRAHRLPNVTATANTPCEGQALELSALGAATYTWSGPGSWSATGANPTRAPAVAGAYTVTGKDANNCQATFSLTAILNANPAPPTITGPSSICAGDSLILTASSLDATSYLWRGSNLLSDSTGASVTATGLGAGVYTFTAQAISAAGCTSALASQTVTVNALPIISDIQSNSPICLSKAALLTANLSGVSGASYIWSGPNGFNQTTDSASISIPGLSAGEHTFKLQVVGVNNCASALSDVTIAVHTPPPNPEYSSNSPLCQGQDLTFTVNAPLGGSWIYYLTGPNDFTHQFTSSFSVAKTEVALNDSGLYYLAVVSEVCTSGRVPHRVFISPKPSPTVLTNSPLCGPANLSLTVANPVSGVTYQWSAPDGAFFTGVNWNRSVINPNMAGVYSLAATALGCPPQLVTANVIIVSWDGLSVSSNAPVCIQGALRLTASVDIPGAVYTWRAPSGQTIITQEPRLEINPVTLSDSGVYTLTASFAGCHSPQAFSQPIVIHSLPQPTLYMQTLGQAPFRGVCQGAQAAIRITNFNSFPPQTSYTWNTPKGTVSSNTPYLLIQPTLEDSGNYTVAAAAWGCVSAASIAVPLAVWPQPKTPQVTHNTPLCEGSVNIKLRAASPEPGVTYIWSGPSGYAATGVAVQLPSRVGASGIYSLVCA
jgi:hypothetical protein